MLQSTLYSRLGIPHLANVHCELLLDCHGASCPIDERLRAVGRQAFIVSSSESSNHSCTLTNPQLSQSGRYDAAIEAFESINMTSQNKALKVSQYLTLCVGIIKFKRAIRRYVRFLLRELQQLELTLPGRTGQPAPIF